jgi:hypothetical protein
LRNLERALASAALAVLPVIGALRFGAWFMGPFSAQRSLGQIESAVPATEPEGGYVSSRECQACHPDQYRSWHASYHRTMTQLATPEAVLGNFDGVELSEFVPASAPGGPREDRFQLSRRDGGYWVSLLRGNSAEIAGSTRIAMTTGSHHQQIVWSVDDRNQRLMMLPWSFLLDEKRWVPRTDAFLAPPEDPFGVSYWSDVCIECHSTQGRPRIDERAQSDDARVTELGIACEMCHGPGGPHVAANRWPWRRYAQRDREDATIVNPERLSARHASQICGRCHSVTSYPKADRWDGHWNAFVPGDELVSRGRLVVDPQSSDPAQRRAIAGIESALDGRFVHERFWADGAVRVAGRELNDVVTSPCFEGGEFSCLSCHSLHEYEDRSDQLATSALGDGACLQCHSGSRSVAANHTHHAPESSGSRCANCHQPYTTFGLLKAIRSHRVSSPSVAAELATGRPNACNACHLDQTLAWTQQQLERDYGVQPVPLDEAAQSIAAGPRWVATGDAGVRALAAWYLGWEPARRAAGSDWRPPYLAELLADPYSAVRAVAFRSLQRDPSYQDFAYDYVRARGSIGDAARERVQADWARQPTDAAPHPLAPLVAAERRLDRESWAQLLTARDTRPISLSE